jgi:hypothetical protein
VGAVDADALPTSEKLSPAAPSTFAAAALVVRFCFEACLTRGMAASSVSPVKSPGKRTSAKPARKSYLRHNAKHPVEFRSSS